MSISKQTWPVLEMSCASCAVSVESTLRAQPGVRAANVNFATATVQVEYDAAQVSDVQLQKAVQAIGYNLLLPAQQAAATGEQLQAASQQKLRTTTITAVTLAIPLTIVGMFFMNMPFANYIMWALATPILLTGKQFFINAWKQARHGRANMDTLVAVSTGVAYLFSVFNTVYPAYWHSRGLHAHTWFEAAGVVIAFILLGRLLEEKAKGNTSAAIKKLVSLQPKEVTVIMADGSHRQIPVAEVQPQQVLLVKPGEKIAVDGRVTEGASFVEESMLSGEPVAVAKKPGDQVFAGTINQQGSFRFTAEKVGTDTVLAHIIAMVQQAQGSKAPVQKLVDKIAGIFVPVVMAIALLSGVVWAVSGADNAFTQGILAMVTVLVIACPCALGLATPTAIITGIGRAAQQGILIKDAENLQQAAKITTVVLDKTGTLTVGKPVVTGMHWLQESDKACLPVLAAMEQASEHPLAAAIVAAIPQSHPLRVQQFTGIAGQGISAQVNNEQWYAGNKALLQQQHIIIPDALLQQQLQWQQQAHTVIYFSNSKQALAVIAIADQVKEEAAEAVQQLQQQGIEVYMLTGDNEATARSVAQQTGITQYRAGVLPAEKAAFIKALQQQHKVVAMVGDGINDSAALATANVSIAMGKGSDIAMEVAAITIISSRLTKIPQAIRLSARTVRTIRQNLFWAFIYNITGIPVAAGILYPVSGFLLNPMVAGAAMALSSVSVVLNSLRNARSIL